MQKVALLLLVTSVMGGQTLTFTPGPSAKKANHVTWSVTMCSPSDYQLPVGRIYGVMVAQGITPFDYQSSIDALTARAAKSLPSRVATYAGYAAAGATFLLAARYVQARPAYTTAVGAGATFFSTLIPLAERAEPNNSAILTRLARDSDVLHAAPGGCATTTLLGMPGHAFNAAVPK
jgi:hypothetical protein